MQIKSLTKKRIVLIAILLILFGVQHWIKIPCVFHELTGFYCPGCGITRAFFSLLHLDIISSFHNNIFLPVIIYMTIKYFLSGKLEINQKVAGFLLILVIAYGVLRNIPWTIFDFLRPL